jgi:hypothetical protein
MSQQSFGQTLASINTAGTLYNTFTTAKSMLNSATSNGASAGVVWLPPNFWQLGTMLEIEFLAGVSWASGNTMTFSVEMGPAIPATIAVATSGALKVTTTGGTTEPLYGKILLTCRSVGNGTLATLIAGGFFEGRMVVPPGGTAGVNYASPAGSSPWSEAVPAVGTGFDSTVGNYLDLFLAMGASSASNGFQIQQYKVFSPNASGY